MQQKEMPIKKGNHLKIRDGRLDSIKGFLILTVILAHMNNLGPGSSICHYTNNFVCLFNMPLFVFVSGYVSNTLSKRFFISTFGLIEIYLIYQAYYQFSSNQIIDFAWPYKHLWYLPCLFVWRLLDHITKKWNTSCLLFIAIILAVLCGFAERISHWLSLSRLICFSVFYLLGRLCREKDVLSGVLYKIQKKYGYGVILMTLFGLLFITELGKVFLLAEPYTYLSTNIYKGCLIRMTFMVYTTFLCMAVIISSRENKVMKYIGQITLPIYVYHEALVTLVSEMNTIFSLPLNIFIFIFAILIYVATFCYLTKFIDFNWLLHPITYSIEKFQSNHSLKQTSKV